MKRIVCCVFMLAVGMGQPAHDVAAPQPFENMEPGALVVDSDESGVHNLRLFYQDQSRTVLSGSLPHGDAGFETLQELGVKTVISVDAAKPELERAKAMGLRYIHIPIKYSGITEEQRRAIALALAQSEGTVYVHCHHGKHRGPAAAAIGLIGIGACTPQDGRTLMENAGTSESYAVLWRDVASAGKLSETEIAQAEPMMVEYARIEGLPVIMAEMDQVFDNLTELSENGWQAPESHPDLSAEAEMGRLYDLFRIIFTDTNLPMPDDRYSDLMIDAGGFAAVLESKIESSQWDEATITLEQLGHSCQSCHSQYR